MQLEKGHFWFRITLYSFNIFQKSFQHVIYDSLMYYKIIFETLPASWFSMYQGCFNSPFQKYFYQWKINFSKVIQKCFYIVLFIETIVMSLLICLILNIIKHCIFYLEHIFKVKNFDTSISLFYIVFHTILMGFLMQ